MITMNEFNYCDDGHNELDLQDIQIKHGYIVIIYISMQFVYKISFYLFCEVPTFSIRSLENKSGYKSMS